jgi:hypothetical protein
VAFLSELISQVFAAFGGADLDDDAVLQQALQALGENVGGDALGGSEKIFKATPSENEIANHKKRPAVSKDIEGTRHRTG